MLDAAAQDPQYLQRYQRGARRTTIATSRSGRQSSQPLVAYFCAEYGFHESFPIYSGGLGILAGDHCKAASDEQLNFVAVGLLYRQGYFSQTVDSDGVQHAGFRDVDPRDLPVEPVRDAQGNWLTVQVPMAERQVSVRLWRAEVGHVSVYPARHQRRRQLPMPTATSPSGCTAVMNRTGSSRRWCWASAACAHCACWASSPPCGT